MRLSRQDRRLRFQPPTCARPSLTIPRTLRAGADLPETVAVAFTLRKTLGALLAIGRPGRAFEFRLHQPLGGKADHLVQEIGFRGLLHERSQVIISSVVGGSSIALACRNRSYRRIAGDQRKATRLSATALFECARAGGFALLSDTITPDSTQPAMPAATIQFNLTLYLDALLTQAKGARSALGISYCLGLALSRL